MGFRVGHRPPGLEAAVPVVAADEPVEIQELLRRDDAVVQRGEAVLDAGVVEGAAGEAGLRVAPVDVDVVTVDVAARAVWVAGRVVPEVLGQDVRAELAHVHPPRVARDVRHRGQGEEPGDGPLLLVGEADGRGLAEVAVEKPGVGHHRDGAEADVREAAARNDAVEQAGIVVGDLVVLVRPAGAAPPDRVARRPVRLDEALLDEHHRLRGQQVVAVVAVDVEAGRRDRVALPQHRVVGDAARACSLAVPAVHAAAAQRVDEPPVPPRRGGPRIRLRMAGPGGVQHGDLVDGPVRGAGLDADDVRHLPAGEGRRGRVGRQRGRIRERREQVRTRRAVDVVDPAGDRAVLVERRPEFLPRLQLERFGLADERLLVRSGEDRTLARVVDERHRRLRTVPPARP